MTEIDNIVNFHEVTWKDYERVCDLRGDDSVPRIHYLEGELEILKPSREHERIKCFIRSLVTTWCIDRDIELSGFGSWTVQDEKVMRGAEADDCYIFGREPQKRDRPHLSIEVEWTPVTIDRLAIYEKLGIDEVWIWRKGIIEVHGFAGGKFVRAQRSRVLADLDLELLASMLDRDTLNEAVRDFRKAIAG